MVSVNTWSETIIGKLLFGNVIIGVEGLPLWQENIMSPHFITTVVGAVLSM